MEGSLDKSYSAYVVGCSAVVFWTMLLVFSIPDRWEDSYSYILAAKTAVSQGYSGFWFGKIAHPLYTFFLYLLGIAAGGNTYVAGKAISVIAFFATLFFLFKISLKIGNLRTACLSILLCTVVFLDYSVFSVAVLAGPLFISFLIAAIYYQMSERKVLAFLLLGTASLIRAEFIIALVALLLIYTMQRRIRTALLLLLINLPFLASWYFLMFTRSSSPAREIAERFGDRSLLKVVGDSLEKLSFMLVGGSAFGSAILIGILFIPVVLVMAQIVRTDKRTAMLYIRHPLFLVAVFVVVNFFAISILNYTGRHPLAVRHFGYLVPFIALLTVHAVDYLDGKARRVLPLIRLQAIPSFLSICLLAAAVYGPWGPAKEGRFYHLAHYVDAQIYTARYLTEKLSDGEKFISPLPSVIYYSGHDLNSAYMNYPENILDVAAYRSKSVKYVAWSNIYAGHNLVARDKLGFLRNSQDYLFFRHIYSPPFLWGWQPVLYAIDEYTLTSLTATLGTGWYGKEQWGIWAQGPVATLYIHAPKRQRLRLSFKVGSYVEPATMDVYAGDALIGRVEVGRKEGWITTPTTAEFQFNVNEGVTAVKFVGPEKTFVPIELGHWKDKRHLRLGFSDMRVNDIRLF